MIVYSYHNDVNGKRYIGITSRQHRHSGHVHAARTLDLPFYRAVRHYGWDAFTYTVLAECDTMHEMRELERYYIRHYDTYNNGYNATDGGEAQEVRHKNKRTRSEAMQSVHRNICEWEVVKDGVPLIVVNLKRWCRDNNYNFSALQHMSKSHKGEHRGVTSVRRLKEHKEPHRATKGDKRAIDVYYEQAGVDSHNEAYVGLVCYAHEMLPHHFING